MPEAQARWYPVTPLGDVAVMLGLAHVLVNEGLHDLEFLERCCHGAKHFIAYVLGESDGVARTPEWAEQRSGIAAHEHPLSGGKGVGAIGMCFTGNFALSMMLEPAMLAPVLSQPSLPMFQAGGMHIAPDELAEVKARMEREDLTVLAYRFEGDRFCRAERFAQYEAALGDRFQGRVLPDASALPGTPMSPHSVVTLHLIDREGEPMRAAVDEILVFFRNRLRGEA